jgi:hypothetical protein
VRPQMINSPATIRWIEKLLQTPIDDYRKLVVWRILIPYLVNIKRLAGDYANDIIQSWLDKCSFLRRLDFDPSHMIRRNISTVKRWLSTDRSGKAKDRSAFLHRIVTLIECSNHSSRIHIR